MRTHLIRPDCSSRIVPWYGVVPVEAVLFRLPLFPSVRVRLADPEADDRLGPFYLCEDMWRHL